MIDPEVQTHREAARIRWYVNTLRLMHPRSTALPALTAMIEANPEDAALVAACAEEAPGLLANVRLGI